MKIQKYLNTSFVLTLLIGVVLVLSYFFFDVGVVEAQGKVNPGGFVTCEGDTCNACNLVEMANTIIIWLFGVIFLIFAGLMAVAGIGLVTSGGNQSALEAAKSKFKNGIIGILIVMSAWLIVDTVMKGLVGGGSTGEPMGEIKNWGPWAEVECKEQTKTSSWPGDPSTPGTAPVTPLPGQPVQGCTGGTCVALTGVPCTNGCSVSPDLVTRIQNFHAAAGVSGARVTEAMPPSRQHRSLCHNNGTCIDYSKAGGMNAAEVNAVIAAAAANGLRPVYEVVTQAQKNTLVAGGVPAGNILVLGSWISAPHFSIYGY